MALLLHDDILYYIFKLLAGKSPQVSELTAISHCCRQWRSVALNSPSLWTYISISSRSRQTNFDRLNTWIARSKHSLLDVYIDCHWSTRGPSHRLGQYLEILSHHTSRWGTLYFDASPLSEASRSMLSTCDLPELTKLIAPNWGGYSSHWWWHRTHTRMPKLQELDVAGLAVLMESQSCAPPASQIGLKSLAITDRSGDRVPYQLSTHRAIFNAYPHLVHLDLGIDFEIPNHYPPGEEVTGDTLMADLETLRFCYMPPNRVYDFLKHIHAPKLTDLQLYIQPFYLPHLLSKPTFPFPALEHVRLSGKGDNRDITSLSDITVRFLSKLPCLRRLDLEEFTFDDYQTPVAPHMKTIARVCPKLQHVALEYCQGSGQGDAVQALVEERQLHASSVMPPILSLKFIEWTDFLSDKHREWLTSTVNSVDFG